MPVATRFTPAAMLAKEGEETCYFEVQTRVDGLLGNETVAAFSMTEARHFSNLASHAPPRHVAVL